MKIENIDIKRLCAKKCSLFLKRMS